MCMSQTHIVACSSEGVFVWHYRTTSRLITELTHVSTKKGRDVQDRLFHVDLGGGESSFSQTVDFSRVAKVYPPYTIYDLFCENLPKRAE